jgi:hypothetical protein
MTLGNMRRHGVRGLFVTCQHCGHERAVNMDDWPDDARPSFGPRDALLELAQRNVDLCLRPWPMAEASADRFVGGCA